MTQATSSRWADFLPRLISALVMVCVAGFALWYGIWTFFALVVVVVGLMMWEVAHITRGDGPDISVLLGILAAAVLALCLWFGTPWSLPLLALPALIGCGMQRRDMPGFASYALITMLTGFCLVVLRQNFGVAAILCLLATVIVSDVAGYFAGRCLGGPKFWPAISPKKTWSGTVAGWIGAALVGAGFYAAGMGSWSMVIILPLIAFAGQLGDIAESAIKRRAGVKDSSNLIPGHGGVMDRFDALSFAVIVAFVVQMFIPFLPVSQG